MNCKENLKLNINSVDDLKKHMRLSPENEQSLRNIIKDYPMSITDYYLSLIKTYDQSDPIYRMSIPDVSEFDTTGDFDTSGESQNTKLQGLQHKYSTTVLLLSTNKCAMYCRHCFRKRLVGTTTSETLSLMNEAIEYIKNHPEVNNVLISGGDSFMLENNLIEEYLKRLVEIEHLDFIRFGTRMPVVMPKRIYEDQELLDILKKYSQKKQIFVVTQFNHPVELNPESKKGIDALKNIGIIVNNQTVLLKGINDNADTLAELLNTLVSYGINPYYVFQCRPVKGVKASYQIPFKEGYQIVEDAKKKLNGHSKRIRFAMSHITGKIEIVGMLNDEDMIFKYHQSKYDENNGRIFTQKITDDQCWLGELKFDN